MPRRKRDAGASPPAAGAPVELTFSRVIEWIGQRTEALAERATATGLQSTAMLIRRCGRGVASSIRELADVERHLNGVAEHTEALTRDLGRTGLTAVLSVRTPRLRRISSIQAQLRLLRARQKGDDALEAEKQAIHRESGLGMPRISALLAHTNGGLKEAWARRALQSVSGDARRQLAEELSGYGYGTVAQLLKGVGR